LHLKDGIFLEKSLKNRINTITVGAGTFHLSATKVAFPRDTIRVLVAACTVAKFGFAGSITSARVESESLSHISP
jgi:hypothetical protein